MRDGFIKFKNSRQIIKWPSGKAFNLNNVLKWLGGKGIDGVGRRR